MTEPQERVKNAFYFIAVLVLCGLIASVSVDKSKHFFAPGPSTSVSTSVVSPSISSKISDESDVLLNVWLKKMNLQIYSSDKRKTNVDSSFIYTVVVKPACIIPPCADSIGIIKIECDTLSKICTLL